MSAKRKILLLNPPGEKLYVRDYYCSKVSKANYIYHPIDLLMLSGWLHEEYELLALDCIAEAMSVEETQRRVRAFGPDVIVFLTGSVSKEEDFPLLQSLKEEHECLMIGSGDYLLDDFAERKSEAPWLDAVLLDFMSEDLALYLQTVFGDEENDCAGIVDLRDEVPMQPPKRVKGGGIDIPVPRYELFPNQHYAYPFVQTKPFATVLTDYGCPYRCDFCVQVGLGFKLRSVENVCAELDYVHELGFRDLYFADQTFGYKKKRLHELCQAMIDRDYGFSWVAFSRVDVIDEEKLALMKASGCHMLMFGVETPVQRILDANKKDLKVEQIERGFELCKQAGIRTLATFIIGLPGSTYDENLEILDFAKKIDADYASFNVLIPRVGTAIREEAKEKDWIVVDDGSMDQSGVFCVMKSDELSVAQINELRRRITRGFYFRPSYLWKRMLDLRSPYELRSAISNAYGVARNLVS